MADSVSDTLTATVRTVLLWNRTNALEVGAITSTKTAVQDYQIADGADAGEADMVFTDTRTIPAGTFETFDLSDLTQQTLGVVDVPYQFAQIRLFRVRNLSTTAGERLLVGASPGAPLSVYAADVGPASEWFAINYQDAWQVTADNANFSISNPSAEDVSYELYIIGTAEAA